MKKLIAIIIFLALIAVPAMAGNDEPQKYQVDFTLRYNAVDAETMANILIALEQLKKQAGSVKLEPCKWDVKIGSVKDMAVFSLGTQVWDEVTITYTPVDMSEHTTIK